MTIIEEQAKTIRREGKILKRFDQSQADGITSGFFIQWQGAVWSIRMHNGRTLTVRNLGNF